MLRCVEGIYREGQVELLEAPEDVRESRVIVTFLPAETATGRRPDLTPAEVAQLRWKLASWEEDWNAPGMQVYDEYPSR